MTEEQKAQLTAIRDKLKTLGDELDAIELSDRVKDSCVEDAMSGVDMAIEYLGEALS